MTHGGGPPGDPPLASRLPAPIMEGMETRFPGAALAAALLAGGPGPAAAQDLMKETIRKMADHKRSLYLNGGVVHGGVRRAPSRLAAMRHSPPSDSRPYERVVFEFDTVEAPAFYGHLDSGAGRVSLDFFEASMDGPPEPCSGDLVEGVDFFPISPESLSVEINLKGPFSADVFYLASPGRVVVDVKRGA